MESNKKINYGLPESVRKYAMLPKQRQDKLRAIARIRDYLNQPQTSQSTLDKLSRKELEILGKDIVRVLAASLRSLRQHT